MFMQDLSPSGCHTYLLHKCCVSDVFFHPLIKKIVDFADSRITCPAQRQFASSILSPAPVDRTGPHMRHCRQCVACQSCFFCCACLACTQFASPAVCSARFPTYNCHVYSLLAWSSNLMRILYNL